MRHASSPPPIKDAAGNTVSTGASSTLDIAFTDTAGAGTLSGLGTATAVAGVATVNVTGVLAGATTTTADETPSAGLSLDTLAFDVVHGAAADIALTGSTADLTSGATRVLTATLKDAAGNVTTNDSSTVVAFAKASGAGTVTGTGNATAANGVATKTITGQTAGAVVMEATSTGLTTGTLASFTVVHGATDQAQSTVDSSPAAVSADGAATSTITVTLRDAAGNPVAGPRRARSPPAAAARTSPRPERRSRPGPASSPSRSPTRRSRTSPTPRPTRPSRR